MAVHDITFRTMAPSDIDAGLRLTRAAGWNQVRRDWEKFLERSPEGCFVAEKAGKVIGTSATIRYQDRFSWIGMVLVDPAERGQGIGRQLIHRAVEALAQNSCIGLDATLAGEGLYRKFDFRRECNIRRLELETPARGFDAARRPAPKTRHSTAARIRPIKEEDLAGISRLDFEAFGADRSFLLRWLWEGAPEYAWGIEGPAGIEAYVLGRHGFDFEHLGPIAAPSVEVAQSLLLSCLRAVSGRPVVIDARDEPDWLKLLSALGFREQRPFIRMFRGEAPRPPRPELPLGVLGPEFG